MNDFLIKLLCCWIPVKKWRKNARSKLRDYGLKIKNKAFLKQLSALKKQGYVILYPPQGMGDILFMWLAIRGNNYPKACVLVTKKHFEEASVLLKRSEDTVFRTTAEVAKLACRKYGGIDVGATIYAPTSKFDAFENAIAQTIGTKERFDFVHLPEIAENEEVDSLFEKGVYPKGKTVLICPEATTSKDCFPADYWLKAAEKLKEKGYTPVFNTPQDKDFAPFPCIFYPLQPTVQFVRLAGNVLSFRSGLSDILGYFCDVKHVVIYPNNWEKGTFPYIEHIADDVNDAYFKDGSLNRLFPHKKFDEFIYAPTVNPTDFFKEIGE